MKILFLSYYFEPDLSAGSFRATALVNELSKQLTTNDVIDVVTTQPNRYHSFSSDSSSEEVRNNVSIYRVKLPAHKNGFVDQALTFRHYAKFVSDVTKGKSYDLVVATSSRLMTAVLASRMARKLKAKLYLDIRDIFVDTISDVFPRHITIGTVPVFSFLERYAISRADHVNLVSEGFKEYFSSRYPKQSFSYFTNGIDEVFTDYPWATVERSPDDPCTVLYAGNMGDGQGLHLIVPQLAKRVGTKYQFRLIGDGGRRKQLQEEIDRLGVANVTVLPPVKRDALLSEYENADILFLHLNDVPAFEKVLPSKLFEYGATGKPILAGVAGYAARFVQENIESAALFFPCDVDAAAEALQTLTLERSPRAAFIEKFSRASISTKLAADIIKR